MAYTLSVRVAAQQALFNILKTGTGVASLNLLAGATVLATLPIDHDASAVSNATGELTLVPVSGGATVAASGTVTLAQLLARDGTILEDAIPVASGVNPAAGKVVLSSLNLVAGAHVDLISAVIG